MISLAQQRCYNHAAREAAVRCPGCSRFFCRECVSEHEHRLLCAQCLREEAPDAPAPRRSLGVLKSAAQLCAGVVLLWVVFFVFGRLLALTPSAFHGDFTDPATVVQEME